MGSEDSGFIKLPKVTIKQDGSSSFKLFVNDIEVKNLPYVVSYTVDGRAEDEITRLIITCATPLIEVEMAGVGVKVVRALIDDEPGTPILTEEEQAEIDRNVRLRRGEDGTCKPDTE